MPASPTGFLHGIVPIIRFDHIGVVGRVISNILYWRTLGKVSTRCVPQHALLADRIFVPPQRSGPRPRTRESLPHLQVDQLPPREMVEQLVDRSLRLPYVATKESRMALPQSIALCLPDSYAVGPSDAFIDNHEFCHLNPLPEGTIHLTLPAELRVYAMTAGWAEPHPAARIGVMPAALVTVYAPRNSKELAVVLEFIVSSYEFARFGVGAIPTVDSAIME